MADADKVRKSIKTKLERIKKLADDHDTAPLAIATVDMYIDTVNKLIPKLDEAHTDLLAKCTDDAGVLLQETTTGVVENLLYEVGGVLGVIKASFATSSTSATKHDNVKLPRVEIPTFDGRFENWSSFQDLFAATIDNNASLSGAQKLQYLKASVKGDASGLIKSLQITDANYQEALDILTQRYDNEREIINSHVKRLFNQPAMKVESPRELQKLLDTTNECLRALAVLKLPVDKWDVLIVYLLQERMDNESRRQWTLTLMDKKSPTLKELTDFMERHINSLQASSRSIQSHSTRQDGINSRASDKGRTMSHHSSLKSSCGICKGDHLTFRCSKLLSATAQQRNSLVKQSNLCFNCLKSDHRIRECTSTSKCRKCNKSHNTLLHQDISSHSTPESHQTPATVSSHFVNNEETQVLLSTAVIIIEDASGTQHHVRALIDPGSQASFITENCVRSLGLRRSKCEVKITGISASKLGSARGAVNLKISSRTEDFSLQITAYILRKITGFLPEFPCRQQWNHLEGIDLADPVFHQPGSVDILLGANYSATIMKNGILKGSDNSPYGLNSKFGWLISGNVNSKRHQHVRVHLAKCDSLLTKFYELEELQPIKHLTREEKQCEEHFELHHGRDASGRYIVQLPLTSKVSNLGNSLESAITRFKQIERRLANSPERKQQYQEFIHEYKNLNHMELVPQNELHPTNNQVFYLPHHFVIREESSTTKLRVVFDGSAKTSTGVSLNDCLMVGPTIQDDLFSLLVKFRTHIIALKADISKMFRQFKVNNSDADLQRIVWRDEPHLPIQHYRLLTVTYGTSVGPYLATRCLRQLALDEKSQFPAAAQVLLEDFYVDDLMSGAPDKQQAIQLQQQLTSLLQQGGMELRKWSSSDPDVIAAIPEDQRESELTLNLDKDSKIKALGVQWNPCQDCFMFSTPTPTPHPKVTKRLLLSEIAKIFDPLGFLAPTTIRFKILLQDL